MEIKIYKDEQMDIDAEQIVHYIDGKFEDMKLSYGGERALTTAYIHETTYKNLLSTNIQNEADLIIILTNKPYLNNFFNADFGIEEEIIIYSFFNWYAYTDIPKNNGLVYFLTYKLAVEKFDLDENFSCDTPGCIFDFLTYKPNIDMGMRIADICPDCKQKLSDNSKYSYDTEVRNLLNDLSEASKWGIDIINYWNKNTINVKKSFFRPNNTQGLNITDDLIESINNAYNDMPNWLDLPAHEKGQKFENFVQLLFKQIDGWTLIANNQRMPTAEIDIIFQAPNAFGNALQQIFRPNINGNIVFIECKYEEAPSDTGTVMKLQGTYSNNHNVGVGVLFAYAGITGYDKNKLRQRQYGFGVAYEFANNTPEKLLLLMDKNDIEKLKNGDNLITILKEKYIELAILANPYP